MRVMPTDHKLLPDVFSAAYALVECCASVGARSVSVTFASDGFYIVLCEFELSATLEPATWSNFTSCWQRLRALCHDCTMTASTGHGGSVLIDIDTMKAKMRRCRSIKLHVSGWQKMGMCDLLYQ